jgi:hypothetical protein
MTAVVDPVPPGPVPPPLGGLPADATGEATAELDVVAAVVVEELLASQADNTRAARTLAVTAECERNDLRLSLIISSIYGNSVRSTPIALP